MIGSQLRTLLWLRWRLVMNYSRRHGMISYLITVIFRVLFVVLSVITLVTGYLLGAAVLPEKSAEATMWIWVGVAIAYLTFALLGVLLELARSDLLSLNKLLHLPMTPSGAFLINYLGSSLNLNELIFFSGMIGMALGLVVALGSGVLPVLPLVGAFFLMITALVHQFRGWLASMVANPRRRQTVFVIIGMGFILLFMLPSVPNMVQMYRHSANADTGRPRAATETAKVNNDNRQAGPNRRRQPMTQEDLFLLQARIHFAGAVLPPGWVAYGVVSTLERRYPTALACTIGMFLIGVWSLRRSYRTTLRLYQGDFSAGHERMNSGQTSELGHGRVQPATAAPALSWARLPFIPEPAAAIATANFRAMLRMPEMKLFLLSPLFMLLLFGGMIGSRQAAISEYLGALRILGLSTLMLVVSIMYLLNNQYAYDRSAFRAFVLGPAPRREVLLGKNLAYFPFALGLMGLAIGLCQWLAPLRLDHLTAVTVQIIPTYLLCCVMGNAMSIYLPVAVKTGGMGMPAAGQGLKIFLRFLATLLSMLPLTLIFLPLGIEYLMSLLNWGSGFPAFLFFALIQAALMIWLYAIILGKQAEWLQRREQEILAVVTTKAE